MKIVILNPKDDFTKDQVVALAKAGDVVFMDLPTEHPISEFKKIAEGAEILAVDPDNFGGFQTARDRLTELMDSLPHLRGLALDTTSYGWVDLEYCKSRNIPVSNCPG